MPAIIASATADGSESANAINVGCSNMQDTSAQAGYRAGHALALTRNALLTASAGNQILHKQRHWESWISGLILLFHSRDQHERARVLIGHNTRLIGLMG
jgi:hypothetical protein